LVVDNAVELVAAPTGAASSELALMCEITEEPWALQDETDRLRREWLRRNPAERNSAKMGVRRIARTAEGIRLELRRTDWAAVQSIHGCPPLLDRLHPVLLNTPSCSEMIFTANIASMHVVVETADRQVLLTRRGEQVRYHPGCWSASFEEGMEPADNTPSGNIITNAVMRGVREELTGTVVDLASAVTTPLAVLLEWNLMNPAIVVLISIPYSLAQLAHGPIDSEELQGSVAGIPGHASTLAHALLGQQPSRVVAPAPGGAWHPTSRYRLLRYGIERFGIEALMDALSLTSAVHP
jgi:hypothetical protein